MTDVQFVGWRSRAECSGLDIALFYPEPPTGTAKRAAKAVCARCDVRLACLLDALATNEAYGIRGGLSARERRTMARRLREQHVDARLTRRRRQQPAVTMPAVAARSVRVGTRDRVSSASGGGAGAGTTRSTGARGRTN